MDSVNYCSVTSSASSTICLPQKRIKFSKDQITVGGNSFRSASDALLVYLQQYHVSAGKEVILNGQNSGNKGCDALQLHQYLVSNNHNLSAKNHTGKQFLAGGNSCNVIDVKEDVESLLTSKISSPHVHENIPVPDTLREVKLQQLLSHPALKSQHQAKTELQHEVEAALLRSAQLLEKVTKEDISSTRALTTGNNSMPSQDIPEIREKQSGHIYSYRTTRPQRSPSNHALSTSLHTPISYQKQSRELRRSPSTDNLLPPSHRLPPRGRWSLSCSTTSLFNQSDPSDVHKSVRSRSESPGLRNLTRLDAPGLVQQLDECVHKPVPSWVGELSPSEVSNSLWNSNSVQDIGNDKKSYTEPGWVGKLENSIFSEDSLYVYEPKTLIPRMSRSPTTTKNKNKYIITVNDINNYSDMTTDSRPGLNFSDLAISNSLTSSNNKQVTAINSTRKENSGSENYQSRQPLPIQTNHTVTHSETVTNPQHNRMLDSEYTGEAFLHNSILPQTARLKRSMDNFMASSANLRHKSSSDLSTASSGLQCSSIDTLSLLTGRPLLRKDVLAFNGLSKDDSIVSQSYSTSAVLPRDRSSSLTRIGQDQCSLDELDGDRTWEKMAGIFKPPVPVDNENILDQNGILTEKNLERTLSGRKQPGSMETLKNMLFKLQAEESSIHDGNSTNEESSFKNYSKSYTDIIPALQNYDFKKEPGGQSLEKALVHLNRLKKLVQSTAPGSVDETVKITLTNEPSNRNVKQEDCQPNEQSR